MIFGRRQSRHEHETRISEFVYFVRDLQEAIDYYTRRLGFELHERDPRGYAVLLPDDTHRIGLMLVTLWDPAWRPGDPLPAPRIMFRTSNLGDEVSRLTRAGAGLAQLRGPGSSVRGLEFRDQDGNEFFMWEPGSRR